MDRNLLVAMFTLVAMAGAANAALVLNGKRFELMGQRLDKIDARLDRIARDESPLDEAKGCSFSFRDL